MGLRWFFFFFFSYQIRALLKEIFARKERRFTCIEQLIPKPITVSHLNDFNSNTGVKYIQVYWRWKTYSMSSYLIIIILWSINEHKFSDNLIELYTFKY